MARLSPVRRGLLLASLFISVPMGGYLFGAATHEAPAPAPTVEAATGEPGNKADAELFPTFAMDPPELSLGPLSVATCSTEELISATTENCYPRMLLPGEKLEQRDRAWLARGYSRVEDTTLFLPVEERIATYNVLGAGHTDGPDAERGDFPPSEARMLASMEKMTTAGLSLAGLQELQASQFYLFRDYMPTWGVWPGHEVEPYAVQNSIVWDAAVWRRIEAHTIPIPYFEGQPFKMPYLLLEHRASGNRLWVANFHNPADTRGDATELRARATELEARLARRLGSRGVPVLVTGDMNAKEEFICPFSRTSGLRASTGSGWIPGEGCAVRRPLNIDWITGSPQLTLTDHEVDSSTQAQLISDHPMIRATLGFPPLLDRALCQTDQVAGEAHTYCPTAMVRPITAR